jgi:flavin reductase
MIDTALFRDGMSRLAGAVNLITTDGAAGRHGFTASAVCSVTDTPATLLVCMNRAVSARAAFEQNGTLCVNVLCGVHEPLSNLFASRAASMQERFAAAQWRTGDTGAPILADGAVAFDCTIDLIQEVGTHSVLFCGIVGVHLFEDAVDTLVWGSRRYHRLPVQTRP